VLARQGLLDPLVETAAAPAREAAHGDLDRHVAVAHGRVRGAELALQHQMLAALVGEREPLLGFGRVADRDHLGGGQLVQARAARGAVAREGTLLAQAGALAHCAGSGQWELVAAVVAAAVPARVLLADGHGLLHRQRVDAGAAARARARRGHLCRSRSVG
jgi:hypothetical protein